MKRYEKVGKCRGDAKNQCNINNSDLESPDIPAVHYTSISVPLMHQKLTYLKQLEKMKISWWRERDRERQRHRERDREKVKERERQDRQREM